MRRLPVYIIASLSCLAAAGHFEGASAGKLTPLTVTELLTSSYVVDLRCRFLTPGERRELAGYAADAKQAASQIEGISSTLDAIERGHSAGETAECSSAARQKTMSTLAAARRAMAAAETGEDAGLPGGGTKASHAVSGGGENLDFYERRVGAYLLDLRCRHLSRRDARRFWALVSDDERTAAASFGAEAVGLANSRAQEFSLREPCNSQSKQLVRSEYRKRTSSLLR
jgi:hypothetical protein